MAIFACEGRTSCICGKNDCTLCSQHQNSSSGDHLDLTAPSSDLHHHHDIRTSSKEEAKIQISSRQSTKTCSCGETFEGTGESFTSSKEAFRFARQSYDLSGKCVNVGRQPNSRSSGRASNVALSESSALSSSVMQGSALDESVRSVLYNNQQLQNGCRKAQSRSKELSIKESTVSAVARNLLFLKKGRDFSLAISRKGLPPRAPVLPSISTGPCRDAAPLSAPTVVKLDNPNARPACTDSQRAHRGRVGHIFPADNSLTSSQLSSSNPSTNNSSSANDSFILTSPSLSTLSGLSSQSKGEMVPTPVGSDSPVPLTCMVVREHQSADKPSGFCRPPEVGQSTQGRVGTMVKKVWLKCLSSSGVLSLQRVEQPLSVASAPSTSRFFRLNNSDSSQHSNAVAASISSSGVQGGDGPSLNCNKTDINSSVQNEKSHWDHNQRKSKILTCPNHKWYIGSIKDDLKTSGHTGRPGNAPNRRENQQSVEKDLRANRRSGRPISALGERERLQSVAERAITVGLARCDGNAHSKSTDVCREDGDCNTLTTTAALSDKKKERCGNWCCQADDMKMNIDDQQTGLKWSTNKLHSNKKVGERSNDSWKPSHAKHPNSGRYSQNDGKQSTDSDKPVDCPTIASCGQKDLEDKVKLTDAKYPASGAFGQDSEKSNNNKKPGNLKALTSVKHRHNINNQSNRFGKPAGVKCSLTTLCTQDDGKSNYKHRFMDWKLLTENMLRQGDSERRNNNDNMATSNIPTCLCCYQENDSRTQERSSCAPANLKRSTSLSISATSSWGKETNDTKNRSCPRSYHVSSTSIHYKRKKSANSEKLADLRYSRNSSVSTLDRKTNTAEEANSLKRISANAYSWSGDRKIGSSTCHQVNGKKKDDRGTPAILKQEETCTSYQGQKTSGNRIFTGQTWFWTGGICSPTEVKNRHDSRRQTCLKRERTSVSRPVSLTQTRACAISTCRQVTNNTKTNDSKRPGSLEREVVGSNCSRFRKKTNGTKILAGIKGQSAGNTGTNSRDTNKTNDNGRPMYLKRTRTGTFSTCSRDSKNKIKEHKRPSSLKQLRTGVRSTYSKKTTDSKKSFCSKRTGAGSTMTNYSGRPAGLKQTGTGVTSTCNQIDSDRINGDEKLSGLKEAETRSATVCSEGDKKANCIWKLASLKRTESDDSSTSNQYKRTVNQDNEGRMSNRSSLQCVPSHGSEKEEWQTRNKNSKANENVSVPCSVCFGTNHDTLVRHQSHDVLRDSLLSDNYSAASKQKHVYKTDEDKARQRQTTRQRWRSGIQDRRKTLAGMKTCEKNHLEFAEISLFNCLLCGEPVLENKAWHRRMHKLCWTRSDLENCDSLTGLYHPHCALGDTQNNSNGSLSQCYKVPTRIQKSRMISASVSQTADIMRHQAFSEEKMEVHNASRLVICSTGRYLSNTWHIHHRKAAESSRRTREAGSDSICSLPPTIREIDFIRLAHIQQRRAIRNRKNNSPESRNSTDSDLEDIHVVHKANQVGSIIEANFVNSDSCHRSCSSARDPDSDDCNQIGTKSGRNIRKHHSRITTTIVSSKTGHCSADTTIFGGRVAEHYAAETSTVGRSMKKHHTMVTDTISNGIKKHRTADTNTISNRITKHHKAENDKHYSADTNVTSDRMVEYHLADTSTAGNSIAEHLTADANITSSGMAEQQTADTAELYIADPTITSGSMAEYSGAYTTVHNPADTNAANNSVEEHHAVDNAEHYAADITIASNSMAEHSGADIAEHCSADIDTTFSETKEDKAESVTTSSCDAEYHPPDTTGLQCSGMERAASECTGSTPLPGPSVKSFVAWCVFKHASARRRKKQRGPAFRPSAPAQRVNNMQVQGSQCSKLRPSASPASLSKEEGQAATPSSASIDGQDRKVKRRRKSAQSVQALYHPAAFSAWTQRPVTWDKGWTFSAFRLPRSGTRTCHSRQTRTASSSQSVNMGKGKGWGERRPAQGASADMSVGGTNCILSPRRSLIQPDKDGEDAI